MLTILSKIYKYANWYAYTLKSCKHKYTHNITTQTDRRQTRCITVEPQLSERDERVTFCLNNSVLPKPYLGADHFGHQATLPIIHFTHPYENISWKFKTTWISMAVSLHLQTWSRFWLSNLIGDMMPPVQITSAKHKHLFGHLTSDNKIK